MIVIYIFLLLFLSMTLEFLFGSYGVIMPFTALMLFYLSVIYGWRIGLFLSILCGIIIDSVFGRTFLLSPFLMAVVPLLALVWLYRIEAKSIMLHAIPGAFIALVYLIPPILLGHISVGITPGSFFQAFSNIFFAAVCSAFYLPFIIVFLDAQGTEFGFSLYGKARDEIVKRS